MTPSYEGVAMPIDDARMYGAKMSMEPMGVSLRYSNPASGEAHTEGRDGLVPFSNELLAFEASFDGEVIELAATPKRALSMEMMRLRLRHAFASDEKVLLNGYQSWTDTVERPAFGRIRGLLGVPRRLVDRYTLDGGGDYWSVRYDAKRGCMHGFTYATFRRGEGMVLVGSLDESRGFTLIRTDASEGEVTLETEPPARELAAGERVVLARYAIVRGTVEECYDRWFELAGITARPINPLVGYTSWYRHYGDIDERKLLGDLAGMRKEAAEGALQVIADGQVGHAMRGERDEESEGAKATGQDVPAGFPKLLFQIDDGYCKVGDWLDVDAAKFPHGLASLAREVRESGFLPGLWIAPFVCERDSRLARERSEWLLRDKVGEPIRTGPHWSGGLALDTRNVEVRSYVLDVLHTMTRDWGFGLLKVDFLYAACMVPHGGLNRGELMGDAMDLLRRGVGEDVLILGCGVPLGSAFGKADYCRIGCDVGLDWDDRPHMRMLHRERVSTKNSLANTYGRAPLDGRAFGNDPDVFFLRKGVRLTQAQRDELLFADADLGSVFLTSDDMAAWNDDARARFNEALNVFLARHAMR